LRGRARSSTARCKSADRMQALPIGSARSVYANLVRYHGVFAGRSRTSCVRIIRPYRILWVLA